MTFLIRTTDGRITICTPSADEAAQHVRRLEAEGMQAIVSGMNGEEVQLSGLQDLANAHEVDPTLVASTKP